MFCIVVFGTESDLAPVSELEFSAVRESRYLNQKADEGSGERRWPGPIALALSNKRAIAVALTPLAN